MTYFATTPRYPKKVRATKKVIKQDHRRISKEKHEIAYVRKLARTGIWYTKETERILGDANKANPIFFTYNTKKERWEKMTVPQFKRICQALLKFTKGYTK